MVARNRFAHVSLINERDLDAAVDAKSPDTGTTVARRMYFLFVGNVSSTIMLAVTAIVVGRLLGPEGYGLYTLALVIPGYLASVTLLGIPFAATRYPAKYVSEGDEKKATSFLYSMAIVEGLLGLAAILITIPFAAPISAFLFNRPGLAYLIPLAVVSVAGQLLYNTVTAGFQGLNMMGRSAQLQVLQAAVKLTVSVGLVLAGFEVLGAVWGYTLAFVASGLMGLGAAVLMNGNVLPKGLWQDLREALRYSAPVYLSNLLAGVVPAYLVTLLARFSTNAQIGGYGAAQNLVALISLFIYPISTTLFPLFSGIAGDEGVFKGTYAAAVKYSTMFIVPVAMLMISLATPLASAVYGREFTFAGNFLAVLVVPYLFAGVGSLAQVSFLNGIGETRKTLLVGVTGSAVTFALGAFLAPLFSIYGVLVAAVLGSATSYLVAANIIGRKLGTVSYVRQGWRVYVSSAVAAALVYPVTYLPLRSFFVVLIGGAGFFLLVVPLMALMGAVRQDDLIVLEGYFSGIGPAARLFGVVEAYYRVFGGR